MTHHLFFNSFLQIIILIYFSSTKCYSTYSPLPLFASDFFGSPREAGLKDMKVIHGWKTVDFVFPSSSTRHAMIRTGLYVPGNTIIMDADYYQDGLEDKIFVSLPRLRDGIPATLAKVSSQSCLDGSPKLQPYPDWSWHRVDNCEGLISVFRMKVDDCGRMWVIDSGVTDVLHSQNKACPPKIMVFDLSTDQLLMKYVFPEDVLEPMSLLVTIAIDSRSRHCRDTFAYVADVTEFGLLVFDSKSRRSWRVTSNYFYPYPLYGTFNIAGSEFDLMDGILGLALSPVDKYGDRTLYFHSLASVRESKVSTSLLRNESNFLHGENKVSKKFYITDEVRPSQSAAQDMSESKILFFGLLSPNSIACWNSRLPYIPLNIVTIAQNNETLQFPSGLKVVKKDGNEELLVTTSRFPDYFLEKINKRDKNGGKTEGDIWKTLRGKSIRVRQACHPSPREHQSHKMADPEFEELTHHQHIPQHIKANAQAYTLVHDINVDEDSPTKEEEDGKLKEKPKHSSLWLKTEYLEKNSGCGDLEPARNVGCSKDGGAQTDCCDVVQSSWGKVVQWEREEALATITGERRRRKLPEIPILKKTVVAKPISLAEELGSILERTNIQPEFAIGEQTRPLTLLKCHSYLRDEDSSPDSDRFHSTDVDSGNSTAHSPDCVKSVSPQPNNNSLSPVYSSPPNGRIPFTDLEVLDPTHRGLYRFVRRHHDEMDIEIGDPIYVHKEADDLWCEGVNLRTGMQGVFPSAYVVDVDYNDFDPNTPKVKRERFILGYLGSVETTCHKGNSVLCQAVKKIKSKDYTPYSCILEVSDTGLRMVDRKKPQRKEVPCHDYFYSLKNVSFCAFHPRDHRYLGFITKHPHCDRFACHVFLGSESTRPVAEAVGRAFQRFYQKFLETAYPVEDIYIDEPLDLC